MSRSMSAMEDWLLNIADDGGERGPALKAAAALFKPGTMGGRLKLTRDIYGLKQSDLEEIVGVRDSTISNWEANEGQTLRASHLLALAALYGQTEKADWQEAWILWVLGLRDTPPLLRGFATSLLPEG